MLCFRNIFSVTDAQLTMCYALFCCLLHYSSCPPHCYGCTHYTPPTFLQHLLPLTVTDAQITLLYPFICLCPYNNKTCCHTTVPCFWMDRLCLLISKQDSMRTISCSVVNSLSRREGHPRGCLESRYLQLAALRRMC